MGRVLRPVRWRGRGSRLDRRAQYLDRVVAAAGSRRRHSGDRARNCAAGAGPACGRGGGVVMTMWQLRHRNSALWLAALVHRLSGLALAIFLPVHFLTLGLAISGEARLEGFLRWSDAPLVRLAEGGLVFLLAVHLLGGLRLLTVENLAWHDGQKRLAVIAGVAAALAAVAYLAVIFS